MTSIRLMIVALFTIAQSHAAADNESLDVQLFRALKDGGISLERLRQLVDQGANAKAVKTYDDMECSALHYAVMHADTAVVSYLIDECDIGVDSRNNSNATPCHYAVKKDRGDVIKVLFSKGANVTCKNICGDTPLHRACSMGAPNAVQALLDCGADPEEKNGGGVTPLDIARNRKYQNIVEIIEQRKNSLETKEPDLD